MSFSLSARAAEKPNVLFLIADDLNCDLGAYGHPMVKSPHIDRLAARGLRFDRAYCQYPLCGPSRASFMCGLYPDQTLIHGNAIRIREHLPEVLTMSQMFRNEGYTAARVGKIYRPHTPYVAPQKYYDLYDREKIVVPTVPEGYLTTLPAPARATLTKKNEQVNLSEKVAREAIQAYYASISFMDAQVGRVLDALDRLGLAENTIIVFTSDHGYHMGEHGYYQKTTLFENATRVPLILAAPGMRTSGQSTAAFAEMLDFYPTLAALSGLTPPENLSGVSLTPLLADPAAAPRTDALTQFGSGYSLRTDRYRYTEWGPEARLGAELYDHSTDPHELVNLAGKPAHEETVRILSGRIGERIAAARAVPAGLEQRGKPSGKRGGARKP